MTEVIVEGSILPVFTLQIYFGRSHRQVLVTGSRFTAQKDDSFPIFCNACRKGVFHHFPGNSLP